MGKTEFDDFAESYDETLSRQLGFFEQGTDYFARHKAVVVKRLIKHTPINILDFGCGVGNNIRHLLDIFPDASLTGTDISGKSLEIAASRYRNASFISINELKYNKIKFDLIFVANVFHHIHLGNRNDALHLIKDAFSPEGELFIFEHNPYNPVTRHLVNTCPFDTDAELLKPGEMIKLLKDSGFSVLRRDFILFFPRFLSLLRPLERYMTAVPLGGQYVVQAVLSGERIAPPVSLP
jgi:ubiquinone/menaquinone biosynthesis C-methylase UbiE